MSSNTSIYARQNVAIRTVREKYPNTAQRTLAAQIIGGDFQGTGQYIGIDGKLTADFKGRTFASVYGVIRRIDATARQVAAVPQLT